MDGNNHLNNKIMINPKELRVGNYVQYADGRAIVVGQLMLGGQNVYQPITLTKEWFAKFNPQDKIILKDGKYFARFTNGDFEILELKHVHQLQNLYFALTKEELILIEKL